MVEEYNVECKLKNLIRLIIYLPDDCPLDIYRPIVINIFDSIDIDDLLSEIIKYFYGRKRNYFFLENGLNKIKREYPKEYEKLCNIFGNTIMGNK